MMSDVVFRGTLEERLRVALWVLLCGRPSGRWIRRISTQGSSLLYFLVCFLVKFLSVVLGVHILGV